MIMAKFLITQGNVDYRIDAEHYEVSEGMLDLYKKDNIIATFKCWDNVLQIFEEEEKPKEVTIGTVSYRSFEEMLKKLRPGS